MLYISKKPRKCWLQAVPFACSPHRSKIENKIWVRKKYITENSKQIPNTKCQNPFYGFGEKYLTDTTQNPDIQNFKTPACKF
jgi:hypothetical protein